MKVFTNILTISFFIFCLALSQTSFAKTEKTTLKKSHLKNIKIFNTSLDRIFFIFTDKNDNKYKFSELSNRDAKNILNRFKNDNSLDILTLSQKKKVISVISWN